MSTGGGSTNQTQQKGIPDWAAPYLQDYLGHSMNLSRTPAPQSGIPTVAPINDYQNAAYQLNYDRAMNGDPSSNAGRAAITGIAAGNMGNPWQQGLTGIASGQANQNPYNSFFAGASQSNNPLMGGYSQLLGQSNPFLADPDAMIKANTDTMTQAAQRGVMAQTDAAANRAGAYGGSGYNELQAQNSADLAKQVGQMSAQTRLAANQQNAGIYNSDYQNSLGALGGGTNAWNSNFGNQMGAAGQGANLFNSQIGQQLQAMGMGGNMYQGDIGNMLAASGLAPQYGSMDRADFTQLEGSGNQQNAYQQALLNAGNQNYNQQFQWPFTMNDYEGNAINSAIGNYFTQNNTSLSPPGQSTWMQAIGTAANIIGMLG